MVSLLLDSPGVWFHNVSVNGIRTITLDLDDTLWEIHPLIRRAETKLYEWLGANFPRITEMFSRDDIWQIRKQVGAEFADRSHDLTFMRRMVLSRVGIAAGYGTDFVDDAFDVFDEIRNSPDIFPEVVPALESLGRQFTLVAVTNGNAKLDKIGIDHLFDDIVTAARAGAAKPARLIFDVAVRAGGATPEETLHVGDHWEYDVDGARQAGLRTAWVNRVGHVWPDGFARADIEVDDIGQLVPILAEP